MTSISRALDTLGETSHQSRHWNGREISFWVAFRAFWEQGSENNFWYDFGKRRLRVVPCWFIYLLRWMDGEGGGLGALIIDGILSIGLSLHSTMPLPRSTREVLPRYTGSSLFKGWEKSFEDPAGKYCMMFDRPLPRVSDYCYQNTLSADLR